MSDAPQLPPGTIVLPDICSKHFRLLVEQAAYRQSDPWRALYAVSQVVLFQAATAWPKTHERTGGDVHRIKELGCLACWRPDAFGDLVEAAKTHDLGKLKALGERYVTEGARADQA